MLFQRQNAYYEHLTENNIKIIPSVSLHIEALLFSTMTPANESFINLIL